MILDVPVPVADKSRQSVPGVLSGLTTAAPDAPERLDQRRELGRLVNRWDAEDGHAQPLGQVGDDRLGFTFECRGVPLEAKR